MACGLNTPYVRVGGKDNGCNQAASHPDLALKLDRKSTRLNSSHANISYAVFCLKNNTMNIAGSTADDHLAFTGRMAMILTEFKQLVDLQGEDRVIYIKREAVVYAREDHVQKEVL